MAKRPEVEARARSVLAGYSLPTRPDVIALLHVHGNRTALRRSLSQTLSRDLQAGVARAAELQNSVAPRVRIIRNGTDQLVAREEVPTGERVRESAARNLPMDAPAGLAEFQKLVLIGLFQPTLRYDRSATETERQSARNAVPEVKASVVAGERVIGAHERIDDDDVQRLQAYESKLAAQGRLRPGPARLARAGGGFILNALLLAIFGVMLLFYRQPIYHSPRGMLLLATLYMAVLVPAAVIARGGSSTLLIPIAFPVLVAAVLWEGRMALAFALVLAIVLGAQAPLGDLSVRVQLAAAGAAAALCVRVVHRRAHGLILGIIVAGAYLLVSLGVGLLLSWSPGTMALAAALGSANGIGCALIAVGLMPLFEAWTGITTDQTLLELADLNGPVLKRLSLEAGGTYAHSVNVAHLAEAAARAIGANPVLARVGAYYHDIGKLAAPQYFVENQVSGRNPHDRLSPEESVAVIRGHVSEGERMAEQAKLPECVRAFIPEHHGTQLIGFFFEKAKQRDGGSPDPAEYSYGGPRPRSRETAILLLADSVESATKVLDDPTPDRIRELVDRIVQGKIDRGQLDDAPFTMRDLSRVRQAFVKVLSGMYHHRIDYPASAIGVEHKPLAEGPSPATGTPAGRGQ